MIFVTGANGLVGSQICKELLNRNYEISALKRKNSDLSLLGDFANKIKWIDGDVLDIISLEEGISKAEYVIHSAAIISFHSSLRQQMYKTNVEGTANVVNVCLTHPIKKLLHVSSVAALGRTKDLKEIDEKSIWEESPYNSHYATSKYQAELEVWRGAEEGLPMVIVNPSTILGKGLAGRGSARLIDYVKKESKFYSYGLLNYVDVRDVAEVSLELLFSPITNERYIINTDNIRYKDFFEAVAKKFNVRAPHTKATPFLGELALFGSNVRYWLTGKEPMVTREILRNASNDFIYSNQKVSTAIRHKFRSLEESIEWIG